jgi:hypothetical protein
MFLRCLVSVEFWQYHLVARDQDQKFGIAEIPKLDCSSKSVILQMYCGILYLVGWEYGVG